MATSKTVTDAAKALWKKNRYVLGDVRRPAKRGRVNVDWWMPEDLSLGQNLGDVLSPVLVDWMLEKAGVDAETPVRKTRFLTAVGSVLGMGLNDSTVWGSGLLHDHPSRFVVPRFKKLDVRAVRGPRTAEALRSRGYDCPDVFGDPAIIAPLIYAPPSEGDGQGVLFAHHLMDGETFEGEAFSMQTDDWRSYVDAVRKSSLVVTTSLHGIILAECYGTHAVLMESKREDFSLFKYEDWYLSTGRATFPVAANVEEALTLDPPELPDSSLIEDLRHGLMDRFPYDLWVGSSH